MEMYEDEWDLVENAPGLFIHEAREAKVISWKKLVMVFVLWRLLKELKRENG